MKALVRVRMERTVLKTIEDTVIELDARNGNAVGGLFVHGTFRKYFIFPVLPLHVATLGQARTPEDKAQAIRDAFADCGKRIATEFLHANASGQPRLARTTKEERP